LHTIGLFLELALRFKNHKTFSWVILTPSSTGVEKKSTPVALEISSPPGTPGR
jgi:hypothetical protein